METINTVAKKTNSTIAEVKYFARIYKIPKAKLGNTSYYVFDKKDYKRFLFFKKGKVKIKNSQQLEFYFASRRDVQIRKWKTQAERKRDKKLIAKLSQFLKQAGLSGIQRDVLVSKLKIDDKTLERLLSLAPTLPIGEDDLIDDRLYWIERGK